MPFADQRTSRPLDQSEINALRVNVVMPTAVIAIILLVALVMFGLIVLPMWNSPFVKWFVGAVGLLFAAMLVAVTMHVRNNLGDLRDGVAQIRTGKVAAKRQTGRAPYTFYVTIEGTGELIVWGADYEKMAQGDTYTVAFSPRTRRVWTVT